MLLEEFFKENPRVALGFSGGVDSAYLLYAALKYGADVQPYFIKTAFQPQFELEDALRLAKQLGVKVKVLEHDIVAYKNVASNPPDRCYHCKISLFGLLQSKALRDGYSVLIDGTNASDKADDRPGMKALKELSVRSPLQECGITKSQIREFSKEAGLFTWNKPAYACLATRIQTNHTITPVMLQNIECAENILFSMGFYDFRVRVYHDAARLQFTKDQMQKAIEYREEICQRIKPHFDVILLDMFGR